MDRRCHGSGPDGHRIPWRQGHQLCRPDGRNRFLVGQLNERLGQFIALIEYGRTLDATARLARCIASLFNPILYPDLTRHLEITQEEIGALSGISRQNANQCLKKLEKQGLLRPEYGGVTVIDLERLRNYGE